MTALLEDLPAAKRQERIKNIEAVLLPSSEAIAQRARQVLRQSLVADHLTEGAISDTLQIVERIATAVKGIEEAAQSLKKTWRKLVNVSRKENPTHSMSIRNSSLG
jgi:hypothetical protein